jgi:hypothetical protein
MAVNSPYPPSLLFTGDFLAEKLKCHGYLCLHKVSAEGGDIIHLIFPTAVFDELLPYFYYYVSQKDNDAHQGKIPNNILVLSLIELDSLKNLLAQSTFNYVQLVLLNSLFLWVA